MAMTKEKHQYNLWQNIRYVMKGAWKYDKRFFFYGSLMTICAAILPFVNIFYTKYILEELLGYNRIEYLIFLTLIFFISSALLNGCISYLQNASLPRMVKIRFEYINEHSKKTMDTEYENMENPDFLNDMETATRGLSNDDTGVQGLLNSMFTFLGSIFALLIYIGIVSTLNIFLLLYLVLNVFLVYYMTLSAKRYEHKRKDDISNTDRKRAYIYNLMYDFSYGKEIRIFHLQDWFTRLFTKLKDEKVAMIKLIRGKYFKASFVDSLLSLIREGLVYAYLIYLVIHGKLTVANFTVYFASIAGFTGQLNAIINSIAFMRAQNLDICDLRKFLEYKKEDKNMEFIPIPKGPYEIEFQHVSFHYPNSDLMILKDVSFRIGSEEKVAIVGHNGAGKTTIIKLLCGFYDVTDGKILLNGIDIRKFQKNEYYKLFAAVFQNIRTLAFSVAENVALKDEDINLLQVNDALKRAGLDEKIHSLKNGVNTSVLKILDPEGIELSGGENQRLSLARAIYKNGEVMVLDEPTAALDAVAEYEMYMKFNEISKDKECLFISHRLASTRFCDKILMFEEGRLVEYGTHDQLLAAKGKYADMFEIQAKYYKESGENV